MTKSKKDYYLEEINEFLKLASGDIVGCFEDQSELRRKYSCFALEHFNKLKTIIKDYEDLPTLQRIAHGINTYTHFFNPDSIIDDKTTIDKNTQTYRLMQNIAYSAYCQAIQDVRESLEKNIEYIKKEVNNGMGI